MSSVGIIEDITHWVEKWVINPIKIKKRNSNINLNKRRSFYTPNQSIKVQFDSLSAKEYRISTFTIPIDIAVPITDLTNSGKIHRSSSSCSSISSLKSFHINDKRTLSRRFYELEQEECFVQLEPLEDDLFICEK